MSVKLHFTSHGSGKPAVLLHGLFGSGKNLGGIARHLADRDYQVYVPDLRNHGRSPHSDAMDYAVMADDIRYFCQQHNIRNALMLGHSMGGKVAMVVALQDAQLCGQLIVLDIAPVTYTHTFDTIIQSLRNLDLAGIQNRRDADVLLAEALQPATLRQFLLQNLVKEDGQYHWRMNLTELHQHIGTINDFPDNGDRQYSGPTLFLGGENSSYLLPEHQGAISTLFPNAKMQHIPGAGHWLHAEAPSATLAAIDSFLSGAHH